MILCVDPGSKRIGWAIMRDANTIIDCGLIKVPDGQHEEALDRVDAIAGLLRIVAGNAMKAHPGLEAVLEVTSAHQAGRHKGRMSGLQTLGAGVQACRATLKAMGLTVHDLKENVWTRGQPKLTTETRIGAGGRLIRGTRGRVDLIAELYKGWDWSFDKGGDVRDAVGIGKYWFDWERDCRKQRAIDAARDKADAEARKARIREEKKAARAAAKRAAKGQAP